MKTVVSILLIALPFLLAEAHSPAESNECVRTLLRAASWKPCRGYSIGDRVLDLRRQDVFFSNIETGPGWSPSGRQAAFDGFLGLMAEHDFGSGGRTWLELTSRAVAQCRTMGYTNALSAVSRLAVNGTYPSSRRLEALEFVCEQMTLNEVSTRFVEGVLTNRTTFSLAERGVACGVYINRMLTCPTNASGCFVSHAVSTFYRNRKCDTAGGVMFDKLFSAKLEGYAMSSNRIDLATFVLGHVECNQYERRYFTTVTNELLSSGCPLVQLAIGECDNER